MIRKIKTLTLNLIVAVNIAVVVLMVAVGYSDRLHPGAHPWLSCAGMTFPILPLINLGFLVFWVLVSWRRMVVPIVGFILAYIPIRIYMPLHFSQEPPEKGKIYNKDYSTQQGSHSKLMEKSKAFQTSKS